MGTPVFQKSFNSGEWAPQLYSRVDLEKYKSGAALLENFFVDYRGGASTRTGTQYILRTLIPNSPSRIIPFKASERVSYILELGDHYMRFYNNGAPILESGISITGVTKANPGAVSAVNSFATGNWVYISGVNGMTQLNNNYYIISGVTGTSFQLNDILGNPVDTTGFGTYTSGGTASRVYIITTPWAATDVNQIKFAQSVNEMVMCHPSYVPYLLTINAFNDWTLAAIAFGTTASRPSIVSIGSSLASGSVNYSYTVTSIASTGDESLMATPVSLLATADLRTTPGSITLTWAPVAGAVAYNVYKSDVSYIGAVPVGVPYGYIGQVTGLQFVDSNVSPDFSITPPVGDNPFSGQGITTVNVSSNGAYTSVPAVSTSGGSPSALASLAAIVSGFGENLNNGGSGYAIGDTVTFGGGFEIVVNSTSGSPTFAIGSFTVLSRGQNYSGSLPSSPMAQTSTSGTGSGAQMSVTWGVSSVVINSGGAYGSVPLIIFSGGGSGAGAIAVLSTSSNVNPGVPGFFQQRLGLAAGNSSPDTISFSQPGSYFNYNISSPIQANDAIEVTLAAGQLEVIKSMTAIAPGLVLITDEATWLVTGGSLGSAITPSAIVANRQSFIGGNDVPPILSNYDMLYVGEKGGTIWDSNYNYYAQVFTGQEISVIASHLFYGYQITQWTWAQAPFKVVWMIRTDGTLISLTFAKEDDFIAFSHHVTNGTFNSVASVPELAADGMIVDAVYVITTRTIEGNSYQYIERFANRILNGQAKNAWCVDAGLQYVGAPTATLSGAQHLAGALVTGLADGVVIPPFTMPVSGTFTLSAPASVVTVGLGFTAKLQTLPIDTGDPTIRSKMKKINEGTVEVVDTLGLQIGTDFNNLVVMKDLVVGNVGSMTNKVVTDLVTGEARTYLDPLWQTAGQYCIQQSLPLPATITGVVPQLTVGG